MIKTYRVERYLFFIMLFHVVLGVALSHFNLKYFEGVYVKEDGFIEWLTVDILLFGALMSLFRAIRIGFRNGILFFLCLIFTSAVFVFGAGEELSWGQRIFNIKAPLYFIINNSQQELNFHNLILDGIKLNKVIFGTGIGIIIGFYFLILPILYAKIIKVKKIIDKIAMPIPRIVHILAYILLVLLVQITASGKKGELLEFGGCWIFYLMFLYPKNKRIFN